MNLLPATYEHDASSTEAIIQEAMKLGLSREDAQRQIDVALSADVFLSECGTYQVAVREEPAHAFGPDVELVCISIKRVDREAFDDWRHLQEIKNAVLGPECEAIEIYPAESRLVDTANQRWLWGFKSPGMRVPCGFTQRAVKSDSIGKSRQRPFA